MVLTLFHITVCYTSTQKMVFNCYMFTISLYKDKCKYKTANVYKTLVCFWEAGMTSEIPMQSGRQPFIQHLAKITFLSLFNGSSCIGGGTWPRWRRTGSPRRCPPCPRGPSAAPASPSRSPSCTWSNATSHSPISSSAPPGRWDTWARRPSSPSPPASPWSASRSRRSGIPPSCAPGTACSSDPRGWPANCVRTEFSEN